MTDLIPLTKLNELRFKSCPMSMTTLRYRARNKQLPGAVHMGTWMVDLDVFDAAVREQTDPGAPSPASTPDDLDKAADEIFKSIEYKKAS